jgi:hypothetical protein
MFRASTAHYQEVRCVYVANGTSKMTVSELTGILEVPFATYTLPPDDGLLMPETCRGILIQ